MTEMEGSCK